MSLHIVSLLGLFAISSVCWGENLVCPAAIDVEQKLARHIEGWSVHPDNAPNQLAGVTFFDGPPEQQASLVYDKMTASKGKTYATWSFAKVAARDFWIACSYSGTNLVLSQKLPKSTSQCSVTYDEKVKVAGLPSIERIDCK